MPSPKCAHFFKRHCSVHIVQCHANISNERLISNLIKGKLWIFFLFKISLIYFINCAKTNQPKAKMLLLWITLSVSFVVNFDDVNAAVVVRVSFSLRIYLIKSNQIGICDLSSILALVNCMCFVTFESIRLSAVQIHKNEHRKIGLFEINIFFSSINKLSKSHL